MTPERNGGALPGSHVGYLAVRRRGAGGRALSSKARVLEGVWDAAVLSCRWPVAPCPTCHQPATKRRSHSRV